MKRRRARENPSNTMWFVIGGGAVAVGTAIYFMSRPKTTAAAVAPASTVPAMTAASASTTPAAASAATPTTGTTPATTLTTGQAYTFYGAVPGGVASSQDLANGLTAGGWTGVSVPYFNGQGALPAGIPSSGFVAVGTWNGPNGLAVQPGYTCIAGNCVLTTYVS